MEESRKEFNQRLQHHVSVGLEVPDDLLRFYIIG